MKPARTTGSELRFGGRRNDRLLRAGHLDKQFAALIETIWAYERQWTIEDHIDAAIKYGRQ